MLSLFLSTSPSFLCRSSEEHLRHAFHLLLTRLQEEHAEMRFSAFQVLQELFARSHHFRTLLIANFQEFLELTVGIDHEQPLPPPKEVAQKLRRAAIKAVQEWHEKYGEAYKQLSLGYHFLKQNKKVLCTFTAFKVRQPINEKKNVGNDIACGRPPVEHGFWKTNPRFSVHLAVL